MISSVSKSEGSFRTRYADDVPVIGWREWLAIPTLHVDRIKAKIDTGARTSSIHAFDVQNFTERGAPHVSFSVCPEQHRRHPEVSCVAEILDERLVKSSTGHLQHRYVIEVDIELGGLIWPIELTLARRDSMGFRMLIGREAVRSRFLIDSNKSFLSSRCYADVSTIFLKKAGRYENRSSLP